MSTGEPWFIPRRREALAKWIASRDNPLTARVMVNRIWQGHFGRGIVATPNDFGRQGDRPSDQQLMDWLAVEFMENHWSVKHIHRLIMNSQFYQGRREAAGRRIDSRQQPAPRALNAKMYGPPVVTRLSSGEREAMRDLTMWPVTSDPAEHDRRSVYLFVKRSFRLPMLDTFDAPDTATSCARRENSSERCCRFNCSRHAEDSGALLRRRAAPPRRRRPSARPGAWLARPGTG
jgi:hypothetical protein